MYVMTNHQFMRGVGFGMVAGAALGIAVATKEKSVRRTADKAMKVMGDAADHLTDAMGM